MKREFLEGLGLEKDVIDKIMAEHGKGIEKVKDTLSTKETELADTKKLLEDANKEIEGFKELDIDEIQKKADKYKEDYERIERETKEKIAELEYENTLTEYLNNFNFTNDRIKNSIKQDMKSKEFKLEDGKFLGADDYIKLLQENEPESFKVAEDKEEKPLFTRPTDKSATSKRMTKEEFLELSYVERDNIYRTNPSLYKEING